ncbi:hypothetical protein F5I97DRAFT_1537861 [Phlebopus sp. FC_14]|nr:hypothetical protein F5I97DRAFT_1537861 [Phlebopus sp. FC_14]
MEGSSTICYGVPQGTAKELVDFWVDHFKAQVEARSGLSIEQRDGLHRLKRRRIGSDYMVNSCEVDPRSSVPKHANLGGRHDQATAGHRLDVGCDGNWGDVDNFFLGVTNLRSSEEPGQGRRASQPSAFGNSFHVDGLKSLLGSQRSSLFPWDNAGISSSVTGEALELNTRNFDVVNVDQADVRLRGSSASRRGSSLPSHPGSLQPGVGSPAVFLGSTQPDDDFAFDVPENSAVGLPESEGSPFPLEKSSNDFLEYARMQYRCLASSHFLSFDDVVPKATSTAHVAAAALYHCLVLGTKDLVQLHQGEPYGIIEIRIK